MADQEPVDADNLDAEDIDDPLLRARHALKFGFFYHTIGGYANDEDSYGPLESLQEVQEAVDMLAERVHPNAFSGLLYFLEKLDELAPALLQMPNLVRDLNRGGVMTNAAGAQWLDRVDVPPTGRQWRYLSDRVRTLSYDALPRASRYRKWFDLGHSLGCLRYCAKYWDRHRLKQIQPAVQKLPNSIFESDSWLQQFCEAVKFDKRTMIRSVPTDDQILAGCWACPKPGNDLASFSMFLFVRILNAMCHDPRVSCIDDEGNETYCDRGQLYTDDEGNIQVGAAEDARVNAGAADLDPKPPAIEERTAGSTSQQDVVLSSSLAGRLSSLEQGIMNVIQAAGHRMTMQEIVHELDRNEGSVSVGTVKNYLAGFTRRGILTNRQDTSPRGYGLAEWERDNK